MAAAVVALSLLGANHSRAQRALGLACVGGAPFQRSCQVGDVLAPRGPPLPSSADDGCVKWSNFFSLSTGASACLVKTQKMRKGKKKKIVTLRLTNTNL